MAAEWKKVIVSGSNISQLNNDSGYLTTGSVITAFTTASFNNVVFYASGSEQIFKIETGSAHSGSGLVIDTNVGDRTATFYLDAIPTASLAHTGSYIGTTKVGLGEVVTTLNGVNLTAATATGSFTGSFRGDGSGLVNLPVASRIAVGTVTASVAASGDVFKVETAGVNAFVVTDKHNAVLGNITNTLEASGSFVMGNGNNVIQTSVVNPSKNGSDSFVGGQNNTINGDAALVWGDANTVSGRAADGTVVLGQGLSVSGSVGTEVKQTFLGQWNSPRTASGDLVTIGNGTNVANRSNLAIFNTASIEFFKPVTASFFTGSFVGDGSGLTGLATTLYVSGSNPAYGNISDSINLKTQALRITGSGNEVEVTLITSSNAVTFQVGLPNNVEIAQTLKVGTNLTVEGDLTVNGTASYINTQDLYVEDKFILLASGSPGTTDGGIVIDRGSFAGLNIGYGFDSATGRWGYQAGITDTTNTLDPTGISGSFASYVFTEAAHGATRPTTGEFVQQGAMYTATNGDIFIYA
jgi:hypothetical protein